MYMRDILYFLSGMAIFGTTNAASFWHPSFKSTTKFQDSATSTISPLLAEDLLYGQELGFLSYKGYLGSRTDHWLIDGHLGDGHGCNIGLKTTFEPGLVAIQDCETALPISTYFTVDDNQYLQWQNRNFLNGIASFCVSPAGEVFAHGGFDKVPFTCRPIRLRVLSPNAAAASGTMRDHNKALQIESSHMQTTGKQISIAINDFRGERLGFVGHHGELTQQPLTYTLSDDGTLSFYQCYFGVESPDLSFFWPFQTSCGWKPSIHGNFAIKKGELSWTSDKFDGAGHQARFYYNVETGLVYAYSVWVSIYPPVTLVVIEQDNGDEL